MELTQRLHEMLGLLANDQLGAEQFLTELDRLEQHYAENLDLVSSLEFTPDYLEGKTLQEHFSQQTERIFEALDWMRDFAESQNLEWAERSLAVAEAAESALAEIRAALEDEMQRNQGGGLLF
ncbi:hypothetical protein JST97_15910 [bacterium]|nr:hypothetical protein [bacterium]